MAGAHDVVLGLVDRAEGREAAVLADRVKLVAAAGEDLVRVGLVADVPEHLVARGVEQRVDRHGDLAGAEVRAEVAADLADRVDDQLADLLRDLRRAGRRRGPSGQPGRRSCRGAWSCGAREDVVGDLGRAGRCRPRPQRARPWPKRATPSPALVPGPDRTHSRRSPFHGVRRSRAAYRALLRPPSRRGCRRRSGTPRQARPRSAGTGLWQVRPRPRAPGRSRPMPRSARRSSARAGAAGPARRPPATSRNCPPTIPCAPAAVTSSRHRGEHVGRLALLLGEREAERLGEQPVAGQDRHVLAEGHVAGGLAAAQLVVVHRRQVVVDQRVGVDHLDRRGERQHLVGRRGRAPRPWRAPAPGGCACPRRAASSAWPPRGGPCRARRRSAGPRGSRRPAAAARPGRPLPPRSQRSKKPLLALRLARRRAPATSISAPRRAASSAQRSTRSAASSASIASARSLSATASSSSASALKLVRPRSRRLLSL